MEKTATFEIDQIYNQDDGKSDKWKWRDVHPRFTAFTALVPLFLLFVGIVSFNNCDVTISLWIVLMGVFIQLELIYLSVYYRRSFLNSDTEFDLDDAIFEKYEGQNVKDPILRKAMKLHTKIGLLSYFGIVKCYFIVSSGSYCSGIVFWPSLLLSLFYSVTFVVIIILTIRKAQLRSNQNIV